MHPPSFWRAMKSEPWCFWWLNLYLFFEYVRPQSIYPAIDVLPYAQLTLIATLLSTFSISYKERARSVENTLIIIFAIIVLLSSAFAYSPQHSYDNLMAFFGWFTIYFLFTIIVTTDKRLFIILVAYLLYNFKMSQHGFLSWAQRGFSFTKWGLNGTPGWWTNSGEFGIQLAIFLPLVSCFIIGLWAYWSPWLRRFSLLMPFTAFASVIGTSSRGALVGTSAAFIWLAMVSKARLKVLVSLVIIGSIIFWSIPDESMKRFEAAGDDETSLHRIERWEAGFETMNEYPILGIGFKNWAVYYPDHYTPEWPGSHLVHNMFVEAGTELGYSGLAVFSLMVIFVFFVNSSTRRNAKKTGNRFATMLSYGMDGGLVGLIISGSFVTVLYYPYFWIHMAFAVALNNVTKRAAAKLAGTTSNTDVAPKRIEAR